MKRQTPETPKTQVRVTSMRSTILEPEGSKVKVINCTSRSKEPLWRQLSPFFLGPVLLYDGYTAQRHENAWQYAKVYKQHLDDEGEPTLDYWKWAKQGWANEKAVRFPMGKGAKPEFSLWDGQKLGYIEARKKIYAPTYAELVVETEAYRQLELMYHSGAFDVIWLRDFDGYDNQAAGLDYEQVLNYPKRKMGHAFVLAMCLTDQRVWEEKKSKK